MDKFIAIADPTRRHIIEVIAHSGEISSSSIAAQFEISAPAISQHLRILTDADLVHVEKQAQKRIYSINLEGFDELDDWTSHIRKQWEERFERLDDLLEDLKNKSN